MPTYTCDVCGARLLFHAPKVHVGAKEFCAPQDSTCHLLGLLSASWRLTEVEARQLLDDDIAAATAGAPRAA